MESKNTLTETNLNEILDKINSTTFSKENWLDNNFYKIPEVTYSYETLGEKNENIVNLTLFSDIGNLDINCFKSADNNEKEELIRASSDKAKINITHKIEKIENHIKELESVDDGNNEILKAKKEIILGGLKENINLLTLAREGLPFEEEKAILGVYFKGNIDEKKKSNFYIKEDDRKNKLEKINNLNTEIFGEKITDNKEYIEGNLDYLHEQYENYKTLLEENNLEENRKLNEDEKVRYKGYIQQLQKLSPKYEPKIRKKSKSVLKKDWSKIKIKRSDLKNLFNHALKAIEAITGNMPHIAYFDKKVSGYTDTDIGVAMPDNIPETDVDNFLRLLTHEIEQHSVAQVSHEKLIGNLRGAKNLEVVEGAAVLGEELLKYGENMYKDYIKEDGTTVKIINIEQLSYVANFPKTAMEEILTDEEFYDFLELQNKIEPDKTSPLNRYLRHKRTGFQRKDITYTTGKIKAAKYYNFVITGEDEEGLFGGIEHKNADFSDLYLGKVGYDDLGKLKKIKEDLLKDRTNDIKLPENILISDYILFNLEKKEYKYEKITNFYDYLNKKYPFLKLKENEVNNNCIIFKKNITQILRNLKFNEKINENKKLDKKLLKERRKIRRRSQNILMQAV